MNEREAYIALNMMEKVGPVTVRSLVSALGSASAIFGAERRELAAAGGVANAMADAILRGREAVDWEGEMREAEEMGVRLVSQIDPEYPGQLLQIHDPPLALYVKGGFESRDRNAIAVVGTRRPSLYGSECAGRIAGELARAGFTVVSGLAAGIDTAAHDGALKHKGRTIAVIGSGLKRLYPESNKELAERIAGQGAVVSEYPLDKAPDKTTFPVRNRIVSGLSKGVVVVEASYRSGALITADQALEQGRAVFAVPGRIDSRLSTGPNGLIKQGARLVEGVDDIMQEFDMLIPVAAREEGARTRPDVDLTDDERRLTELLADGGMDVDGLIRASGIKAAMVSSLLIGLEMKRVIRMLPGRMVEIRT